MSPPASSGTARQRIDAWLAGHHVMTLATTGAAGPWAAAVFYALDADGTLLFLSAPKSRHCVDLALDARCAATVQDQPDDWMAIRGLQMSGRVEPIAVDGVAAARERYAQRFPFMRAGAGLPLALAQALDKVRWFRFVPERLRLVDNGLGFGHRDEIQR